mgnify:CR=1 FL=1
MKNTSTEERELHTAQNIINAGTGQSADVEQMCEWFEKHPKAKNLLTDAELLAGEIASIDPERKERDLALLRTRVRGYKRARMVRWTTISVATSAAMVLLCFGIFKYTGVVQPEPELLVASVPVVKDSVPTLIFASGEKMDMTEYAVNKKVIDVVHVTARATDEASSVLNVYKVPRMFTGGLALPDSTIVYLNSDSELSFPSRFSDSVRAVSVRGEAYFEVAKDPERPFFVEMEGVEVRVYGTSFNVNTHQKGNIQTVLVKGSIGVKVLSSGMESVIRPGQMAEFKQGNTKVDVKDVNVAVYTDWKDGIFRFENQRLEDILAVLSNWYDMNVFYQTVSVKELHFSGYMERYKDVSVILEAITLSTGVTFSIQGKTIIVSK